MANVPTAAWCCRLDQISPIPLLALAPVHVGIFTPAPVNIGCHAGTPLHHAAKRGLDQTVKLLLSHGSNPLIMNDDCHTPLDLARAKGFGNVVRAIEEHLCLFAGWLKEHYRPGFLERFAPQFLSRKVWVVVLPCGSRNLARPFKLELAMYASPQDAHQATRFNYGRPI